jgi:hypothetical protein
MLTHMYYYKGFYVATDHHIPISHTELTMSTNMQYILEPIMNISLHGKCVNDIPMIYAWQHCFSINQYVILYFCYPTSLNLSMQTLQIDRRMGL